MFEGPERNDSNHCHSNASTDLPEVRLAPVGGTNVDNIHAPVACQCPHGKEDDSHCCKYEDGSVLILGDDCKVVLLEGTKLVDLNIGKSVGAQGLRTRVVNK